ncbi:MAG: hypothetical protein J7501_00355 [Bdellovibrio sp.]|nr:hypothetical protein [Bdellovibrio sp.]
MKFSGLVLLLIGLAQPAFSEVTIINKLGNISEEKVDAVVDGLTENADCFYVDTIGDKKEGSAFVYQVPGCSKKDEGGTVCNGNVKCVQSDGSVIYLAAQCAAKSNVCPSATSCMKGSYFNAVGKAENSKIETDQLLFQEGQRGTR